MHVYNNIQHIYKQCPFTNFAHNTYQIALCSYIKLKTININPSLQLCTGYSIVMSDYEKQEQSQQIQFNEEQLDQFLQCQKGNWMPYNSNHMQLRVEEYSRLFDEGNYTPVIKISHQIYRNKQQFKSKLEQNTKQALNIRVQTRVDKNSSQNDQKLRLTQKIQAILARRNASIQKLPQYSREALVFQRENNKNSNGFDTKRVKKRKRAVITRQIIERAKKYFQFYNDCSNNFSQQRITFKEIAINLGVSVTEITKLYEQYCKDPLFLSRMKRIEEAQKYAVGSPGTRIHDFNKQRLRFIIDLIKQNPVISQREIFRRINQQQYLLHRDANGRKIPINRKILLELFRMGGIITKKAIPQMQRNINSPQFISYRYQYAKRYLELTEDQNADIYFLGEFSLANMLSLSSCGPERIETFVDKSQLQRNGQEVRENIDMKKQIITAKSKGEDRWGRNVQYLVVISLYGLVYYQIFTNIFKEIDFNKVTSSIGKILMQRNPHQKKYLVVETSFFHKKQTLQLMEKTYSVSLLFLPPKTPMLNPTQYFFSQMKSLIKSKVYKSKRSFADILLEFLQTYKQRNLQSFYSCIGPYIELALKQLPFK